jgi:hypothetical protein
MMRKVVRLAVAAFAGLAILSGCSALELPRWADSRIIDADPSAFLLRPEDLPAQAGYYLPGSGYSGAYHNEEVLSGWGLERGQLYLERTGRVDGYWVDYVRGGEAAAAPEEFFCNVVEFETVEGAQLSLNEYNLVALAVPGNAHWDFVDRPTIELGDENIILSTREVQPDGGSKIWYRIEFSYRNFVGVVAGWGREEEVRHEFVEAAARTLLEKMESAPLAGP